MHHTCVVLFQVYVFNIFSQVTDKFSSNAHVIVCVSFSDLMIADGHRHGLVIDSHNTNVYISK
jgi:hypothetical protein